jgi:hypothetical protein
MNKTKEGLEEMLITGEKCGKLIEQLLSNFSALLKPFLGCNSFMTMGSGHSMLTIKN